MVRVKTFDCKQAKQKKKKKTLAFLFLVLYVFFAPMDNIELLFCKKQHHFWDFPNSPKVTCSSTNRNIFPLVPEHK